MSQFNSAFNVERIDESIAMLKQYLDAETLTPLLTVLDEMAKAPDDATLLDRLSDTVDDMGILQGAVLTYAPYIAILLSDQAFPDTDADDDLVDHELPTH
ncbi:hypothetical protein [Halochromatium sp.]